MNSEDRAEKGARFGCGFVLGLVVAAPLTMRMFDAGINARVAMVVLVGLACGLAAMHFRDSFWRWFSNWFGWFR